MWPNPHGTADLVLFTEEIPNGKLHFLGSDGWQCFNSLFCQILFSSTVADIYWYAKFKAIQP